MTYLADYILLHVLMQAGGFPDDRAFLICDRTFVSRFYFWREADLATVNAHISVTDYTKVTS